MFYAMEEEARRHVKNSSAACGGVDGCHDDDILFCIGSQSQWLI